MKYKIIYIISFVLSILYFQFNSYGRFVLVKMRSSALKFGNPAKKRFFFGNLFVYERFSHYFYSKFLKFSIKKVNGKGFICSESETRNSAQHLKPTTRHLHFIADIGSSPAPLFYVFPY